MTVNDPNNMPLTEQNVQDELAKIRPYLEKDGGFIELVDIAGGYIRLNFSGACSSCGIKSEMQMREALEVSLRMNFPTMQGVKKVNGY